jgi:hypothetical protein
MSRVMSEARVTIPGRIDGATVQARITVHPRLTGQPRITVHTRITGQPRITAARAVRTTWIHRTTLYRTLPAGTLVCGPPAYGTVATVRTPIPAAITAVIAIGAPAGVMGGSTV